MRSWMVFLIRSGTGFSQKNTGKKKTPSACVDGGVLIIERTATNKLPDCNCFLRVLDGF